ncbi:MAG TPA: hypothetical protein DCQ30_03755 [Acidimicrobiaceae bacterium]|nr:hypothetical protein [Acidimicrobiaceae bacterium]
MSVEASTALGPTDVLVVEDDDGVRTSWAAILRTAGWSVEEASDGFVALRRLREIPVGAIVLDVRMPVLDGFGLLDRLYDPPPVVLISGNDYDTEVMARRDKIHTFFLKPISAARLIEAVAAALETSFSQGRYRAAVHGKGRVRVPSNMSAPSADA